MALVKDRSFLFIIIVCYYFCRVFLFSLLPWFCLFVFSKTWPLMLSEPRKFWNNSKAWWKYFIHKSWDEAGGLCRFSQKVFKELLKQPHWPGIFYLSSLDVNVNFFIYSPNIYLHLCYLLVGTLFITDLTSFFFFNKNGGQTWESVEDYHAIF